MESFVKELGIGRLSRLSGLLGFLSFDVIFSSAQPRQVCMHLSVGIPDVDP